MATRSNVDSNPLTIKFMFSSRVISKHRIEFIDDETRRIALACVLAIPGELRRCEKLTELVEKRLHEFRTAVGLLSGDPIKTTLTPPRGDPPDEYYELHARFTIDSALTYAIATMQPTSKCSKETCRVIRENTVDALPVWTAFVALAKYMRNHINAHTATAITTPKPLYIFVTQPCTVVATVMFTNPEKYKVTVAARQDGDRCNAFARLPEYETMAQLWCDTLAAISVLHKTVTTLTDDSVDPVINPESLLTEDHEVHFTCTMDSVYNATVTAEPSTRCPRDMSLLYRHSTTPVAVKDPLLKAMKCIVSAVQVVSHYTSIDVGILHCAM